MTEQNATGTYKQDPGMLKNTVHQTEQYNDKLGRWPQERGWGGKGLCGRRQVGEGGEKKTSIIV